jgi:hypothetical protein
MILKFLLFNILAILLIADVAPSYSITSIKKPIANASSFLKEKKKTYPPNLAVDGDINTSWCEGSKNSGIGEYIDIKFPPTPAKGITVLNGFGSSRELYKNNNRVKDYELIVNTKNGRTIKQKGTFYDDGCIGADERNCEYLSSSNPKEYDKCIQNTMKYCDGGEESLGNDVVFDKSLCITNIKIKILSVFKGKKFDDTCIAEIQLKEPAGDLIFIEEIKNDWDEILKNCK